MPMDAAAKMLFFFTFDYMLSGKNNLGSSRAILSLLQGSKGTAGDSDHSGFQFTQ